MLAFFENLYFSIITFFMVALSVGLHGIGSTRSTAGACGTATACARASACCAASRGTAGPLATGAAWAGRATAAGARRGMRRACRRRRRCRRCRPSAPRLRLPLLLRRHRSAHACPPARALPHRLAYPQRRARYLDTGVLRRLLQRPRLHAGVFHRQCQQRWRRCGGGDRGGRV